MAKTPEMGVLPAAASFFRALSKPVGRINKRHAAKLAKAAEHCEDATDKVQNVVETGKSILETIGQLGIGKKV